MGFRGEVEGTCWTRAGWPTSTASMKVTEVLPLSSCETWVKSTSNLRRRAQRLRKG